GAAPGVKVQFFGRMGGHGNREGPKCRRFDGPYCWSSRLVCRQTVHQRSVELHISRLCCKIYRYCHTGSGCDSDELLCLCVCVARRSSDASALCAKSDGGC